MAITISTFQSAFMEPKRSNRWILSVQEPSTGSPLGLGALSFAAHTGTVPKVGFGKTDVNRINEKWKFANRPEWNELSFSFYDFIKPTNTKSVFDNLKAWWSLIYDPKTGQMGYASEYKTNSTLALLDPKGMVTSTWHIFHMWPMDVEQTALSYDNAEIMEIKVNFAYDYAIPGDDIQGSGLVGFASGQIQTAPWA